MVVVSDSDALGAGVRHVVRRRVMVVVCQGLARSREWAIIQERFVLYICMGVGGYFICTSVSSACVSM